MEPVLSSFGLGVKRYGLPKKVHSDHGGEDIDVCQYMMTAHGHHQCAVLGSSTHNEQIERLWRDVHRSVLVTLGNLFRELAEEGHLDVLNEVDMFCLHRVLSG